MSEVFRYTRRVQMADSDAAACAHFSSILRWVEEAEHAFLHSLGYGIRPADENALQWPRVACSAEFLAPLRVMAEVEVRLELEKTGRSSITWKWEIRHASTCAARGIMKTVCAKMGPEGMQAVPLPDLLRERLTSK